MPSDHTTRDNKFINPSGLEYHKQPGMELCSTPARYDDK